MEINRIVNAKVVTPYRVIENGEVRFENGVITYVGATENRPEPAFDAGGKYIAPGFIDIHTHGAGNCDFMDSTVDAFLGAAATHAKYGTATILPTSTSSSPEELVTFFYAYNEAFPICPTDLPGVHLEGPYFADGQRGAQDPKYITPPRPDEYRAAFAECPRILRWSSAPELPGTEEFARELVSHGILPSIAHTDAVDSEVMQAFEWGYTHVTHLYSGMSGLVRRNAYRYPGVIEASYMIDEMTVEIIADGCHLPANLLKLIYRAKGADKTALVTDSMRGAGMPEGSTPYLGSLTAGQKVIIEDGVAKLMDRTAFAGSVATADRLVRNMIRLAGAPLTDAVRMMTSTPARIMGWKNKGVLASGRDADFAIFDEDIHVSMTISRGKVIFDENK